VQARTGPDGALWIVDMYRYVIEYSHWIPPAVVETLDLRAGNEMGRIYRVLPRDAPSRPLPRLDNLNPSELAAAMDTPNGTQRDIVQQLLVWRGDSAAFKPLMHLAAKAKRPAVRLQALCTLELLGKLPEDLLVAALADAHPGVRRNAVRLAESHVNASRNIAEAVLRLADDLDAAVALQVAASLGVLDDHAGKTAALAKLAHRHSDNQYVITAILTSINEQELGKLIERLDAEFRHEIPTTLLLQVAELAGTAGDAPAVEAAIEAASAAIEANRPHRFSALAALLSGLGRNDAAANNRLTAAAIERLTQLTDRALGVATDVDADQITRLESIQAIGQNPSATAEHVRALSRLLSAEHETILQIAAIDALAMQPHHEVAEEILSGWPSYTPRVRMRAVEALLGRKQWAHTLVAAIENDTVPASQLDTAQRARLLAYPDPEIRKLAERRLSQTSTGARAAILAGYKEAKSGGDASRGKALYQKHCANCHEFRGAGSQVGPGLDASEFRSADAMLREIIDPNRAIDGRYAEYVAITTSGRVKNGILVEESGNAITLRGQQGEETRLLRSELDSLTSTGKSLMPEGFEKDIPPADMADLLAYLCSPSE
jgi:putative heme-binding domain-containing protein